MPTNTSATGGYLAPDPSTSPINGQELDRFLQQWVAGVSGLDGTKVRPRWQAEPPNIPDFGVDWCAVGVVKTSSDTFSAVIHNPSAASGAGTDTIYRQQELDVLASFYGPNSQNLADILSMGVQVSQNREQLLLNGFGVISVGDPVNTSELIKGRWLKRIDIHIQLQRAQARTYAVENLLEAQGQVITEREVVPIVVTDQ